MRRELGATQEDFANVVGISESAYRNKELGKNQFKLDEMFEISEYLGRTVDDIFLPTNFTVRKEKA